ncbi:MAG: ribonuclease HII [Hydrogenoanaerobacterium sp.]
MTKLTVFNMEEFLQTVNECIGAVKLIGSDGRKQNINKQFEIQSDLRRRHSDSRHCLGLTLDITNPKDYFKIVYFTIGDC